MQCGITAAEWLFVGDSFEPIFLDDFESVNPGTSEVSVDLCMQKNRTVLHILVFCDGDTPSEG